jgi:hypothetical protein
MFLSQQIQLLCVLDLLRERDGEREKGENVRERNLLKSAWERQNKINEEIQRKKEKEMERERERKKERKKKRKKERKEERI